MPFPFVALFAVIKAACVVCGAVFCTHKVTEAYKKNQKLKGLKYKDREAVRQAALEANKIAQPKLDEKQNEYEKKEKKIKLKEKELEEAKAKSKDTNLSPEERKKWSNRVILLEEELNKDKNESKNLLKTIKDLEDQIKNNNKTINSTSLTYDADRGWIWEVLTLENILVGLAIYALYNIVRDERR